MPSRPESLSFGKYRYVVDLGSGGMGDVFLAVAQGPQGFNKLQVIKRLRPELAQDPEFLSMFLNEARIAARLNHPNVVQTNEVSEQNDEYFIAMEYLEGQSLYALVKRAQAQRTRVPLAIHLHVLSEVCVGLQHAHDLVDFDGTPLALVHRDCSPQNVFVTYEGEVKVLDFGIAKAADSATVTRTGVLKGKVPYMAPEQLEGHDVDRRADVFAVGAMLWEAAAGVRLWKGLNDVQVAHRLMEGQIPRPSDFEPNVDPKLQAIVMKALAIDRNQRYQTAAELHTAIDAYVAKLGGVKRREVGKYVASLFTDTRRQLRGRIEEELRKIVPTWKSLLSTQTGEVRSVTNTSGEHAVLDYGGGQSGSNPSHAQALLRGTGSNPSHPSLQSQPGSNPSQPGSLPGSNPSQPSYRSQPSQPSHPSNPSNPLIQSVAPSGVTPAPQSGGPTPLEGVRTLTEAPELLTQQSSTMSLGTVKRGTRRRALVLTFVGVATAAVLGVIVMRGRHAEEPVEEKSITASQPSTSASHAPEVAVPALPIVTVDVTPADAKLFVDGALVAAPYNKVMAVGSKHELRAEAPGYVTRTEDLEVVAGGNRVRLELVKEQHAGGKAVAPITKGKDKDKEPPVPSPSAKPQVGKPALDQGDPWSN